MANSTAADHYEVDFHFPMWTMIKEYAETHDCSYSHAADVVMPIYEKQAGIRYRDSEYELEEIHKRQAEQRALSAKLKAEAEARGLKSDYDGLFGTEFNAQFKKEE